MAEQEKNLETGTNAAPSSNVIAARALTSLIERKVTLKFGMKGPDVGVLQAALVATYPDRRSDLTPEFLALSYGEKTRDAVKTFQKISIKNQSPTGIAESATLKALKEMLQK